MQVWLPLLTHIYFFFLSLLRTMPTGFFFSDFYTQRSVTAIWSNPGPWSIDEVICKYCPLPTIADLPIPQKSLKSYIVSNHNITSLTNVKIFKLYALKLCKRIPCYAPSCCFTSSCILKTFWNAGS